MTGESIYKYTCIMCGRTIGAKDPSAPAPRKMMCEHCYGRDQKASAEVE